MSESEERAIRSAAVFEFEEAKRALAVLRCKASQMASEVDRLVYLLAQCRRDSSHLETVAKESRGNLERHRDAVSDACDVDRVLQFDDEMLAAIARFKTAQTVKKSLGYE